MVNRWKWIAIASAVTVVALYIGFGLRKPARPSNVPSDAVYVDGGKAWWWERCSYEPKNDIDRCQIFNAGGGVLWDEVFLPYDGGKTAQESEIKVDGEYYLAGPQYVCLRNGRILIPKSHFEKQKSFLDSVTDKSKTR